MEEHGAHQLERTSCQQDWLESQPQQRPLEEQGWRIFYAWTWARAEGRGQGKAACLTGKRQRRGDVWSDAVRVEGRLAEEGESGLQKLKNHHSIHRLKMKRQKKKAHEGGLTKKTKKQKG